MNFANVKSLTIPEGEVKQISIGGQVVWNKSRVPVEYQEMEYLESYGNEYIDIGQNYIVGDYVYIKAQAKIPYEGDTAFFGRYEQPAIIFGKIELGKWSGAWRFNVGAAFHANIIDGSITEFEVRENSTKWFKNGLVADESSSCNTTVGNLILFGRYYAPISKVDKIGAIKIYEYVQKRNGIEIVHFIPVKVVSTGEYGMFDLVTQSFFGNDGTGAFTGSE